MLAIDAHGVRKLYGQFAALDGVDLAIREGEVFSLLGPNGAGKTTFVEICEGFRQRSGGEVRILGADPANGNAAWRARLGIVLQSTSVFDELTVEEVVTHFASFYPAPLEVGRVLGMVGLENRRKARCGKLSGGQKRRVDLAIGIVGDPELMFLDEPTTGLDPQARRQVWDVVREFVSLKKTVLLTTHYLDEAETLAERVGVIIAGKLVEVGTPATLGGREQEAAVVSFRATGALAGVPLPAELDSVARDEDGLMSISTMRPTETVSCLSAWAGRNGERELPALIVRRPTLEDIYLELIARHAPASAVEGAAR